MSPSTQTPRRGQVYRSHFRELVALEFLQPRPARIFGDAVGKISAPGTLTYKNNKISEEGTVTVTVTNKYNDQRLLLSFEDKFEIMVELDPVLLLADEAKGSRLMS